MNKLSLQKYSTPSIQVKRILPKESRVLRYTPLKLELEEEPLFSSFSPQTRTGVFRINSPIFGVEDAKPGFSLKSTPTHKRRLSNKSKTYFSTPTEATRPPKKLLPRSNNYFTEVADPAKDGWSRNLGTLTDLASLLKKKGALTLKQAASSQKKGVEKSRGKATPPVFPKI